MEVPARVDSLESLPFTLKVLVALLFGALLLGESPEMVSQASPGECGNSASPGFVLDHGAEALGRNLGIHMPQVILSMHAGDVCKALIK